MTAALEAINILLSPAAATNSRIKAIGDVPENKIPVESVSILLNSRDA
ncbi:MAG: hypothetical protein HC812_05495 [Leptolyngbya sp. RL_3_1]|nr:hypothetical protein [Leptolyngbya sp. RL_3_1]